MTALQKFIYEMPHGRANEFRHRVVTECGVTDGLFRMWRTGLPVKKQENRETINRIAKEMFGIEVFVN